MKTTIIGIAGGSSSGKTTVAQKLFDACSPFGSISIVRHDDYYKYQEGKTLAERAQVNYDHPDAYDNALFVEQIKLLKEGKHIDKPVYDFTIHNRSHLTERIEPANVIIVEGILIFAIPEIRELFDIKLFVETPDDVRFIRRLVRDTAERGRSMDSVVHQYLTTVRPMHLRFVEPSKSYADLIIPEGGQNTIALSIITTKIAEILKCN